MATKPGSKASKPSKVVKPKTNHHKRSTPSSRLHRYQSFSERIANFKIDPIRRRRDEYEQGELAENENTYLGHSLREWKDVNLSEVFTAFAKEVEPLCESLAMVVYNEEKIMDLLVSYIQRREALAIEPLLNLLSNFAHDLNTRFEKYFERGVTTVLEVASAHSDPAVIEWSFTCLAWLFKYLSRLLVPDLRPLYNLMAPYLGRERQKPFVVRFSAEAFSYLLRRSAVSFERNPVPLDTIMSRLLQDCKSSNEETSSSPHFHRDGIMTILVEAMKGVQQGVNSNCDSILQSLLRESDATLDGNDEHVQQVTCGTITSLIHHTTAESFAPALETILSSLEPILEQPTGARALFASSIVFTICSVRKGTRITNWKRVSNIARSLFDAADRSAVLSDSVASSVLGTLAVVMQYAHIDVVLPLQDVVSALGSVKWAKHFLGFCDLVARLDQARFDSFVLPYFRRFIIQHWRSHEQSLISLIPRLAQDQFFTLNCPAEMVTEMVQALQGLAEDDEVSRTDMQRLGQTNDVLATLRFVQLSQNSLNTVKKSLHSLCELAFRHEKETSDTFVELALGPVLSSLLGLEQDRRSISRFWPSLCDVSPRMYSSERFWSNLLAFIKACEPSELAGEHALRLQESITRGLCLPSHSIRQDCLEILQEIFHLRGAPVPNVLTTAITIESSPVTLETARSISMNIRKLSSEYETISSDDFMLKIVATYCFGLLHLNLSQAWNDAIEAIAVICQSRTGEDFVVQIAQSWLEGVPQDNNEGSLSIQRLNIDSDGFRVVSDFECPNLAKLSAIRDQVFSGKFGGASSPSERLSSQLTRVPTITSTARNQALKIFLKTPRVAEKRSRIMVPVLLKWTNMEDSDDTSMERWSRKDQKAMLAVFAQFVNPRVLYKSNEVYGALLVLCTNGDVEIQRSALKTILAWKDPAITRYEEHLFNILDEVRFREEVSVFLRDETEDEGIRKEDMDHIMPVLLRLLYGRAIAGNKDGQAGRRKALFVALSRFGGDTLGQYLEIALMPFRKTGSLDHENSVLDETCQVNISYRKQVGVLNMLSDMLAVLGAELEPFQSDLVRCVLFCTAHASQKLDQGQPLEDAQATASLRSIRQTGLQCLVKIFTSMAWAGSDRQLTLILDKIIAPRLQAFQQENLQSVSGILRLFAAWSQSPKTAQLVYGSHGNILASLAGLLAEVHAKDEVRLHILHDILDALLEEDRVAVVLPYISDFVASIGSLIEQQLSKDVLDASVRSLTGLAPFVRKSDEATRLAQVCTDLLTKPSRIVSPATKSGIMRILLPLIDGFKLTARDDLYVALSALFSRLQGSESRLLISEAIASLVQDDLELTEVARICSDLNAMSDRLDEPDHDRRERAFTRIYESWKKLSPTQWLPVIHNCMFYIRDGEDRVNRSSASHGLQLFVDAASENLDSSKWQSILDSTVFPAIERGMLESSELVRTEYLLLLGRLVEKCSTWQKTSGLQGLLVGGDEEASFFSNALHIQHHRRLRALRRLGDEAHQLNSSLVTKVFLPLVEHFVFDQVEGDAGRTLSDQSVTTIATLAKELNLSSFRATFKRYTGYLVTKEDLEKTVLRLLGALVDGFTHESESDEGKRDVASKRSSVIIEELLPPLLKYLHQKDESTVDRRMPVAVSIVKLLQCLPEAEFRARLPAVLTDVSHVLRSRSQEARDQTRKTLTTISSLIGPSYFGFVLKELRGALKRGYQLHVLSFTVHSLLLDARDLQQPGYLDECLPGLMAVILDDIFGVTGQEKDAEEYKSSMKEIKSSKSFDSMELLAKVVPVRKLGGLVHPIRDLLCEKMDMKAVRKTDDLLVRLRKGLDLNPEADSRDMLTFCWELVNEVYAANSAREAGPAKVDERVQRYLIRLEDPRKSKTRGATTSNIFKLFSFALNLVRKVVRRHEELQTPANMAGFLPMAGDALVLGHEEVKLAAVKLLSTIMRVPLPELENNAPVYVKEALAMVKGSTGMNTDTAKAALDMITAVLREKRTVEIKERDIAALLKAIKADVDEPDRQTVIYKFLRSVLHRKIVITEVYEVMDEVAKVMITNPDRSIRESARSAYLQFIMEYPQGKERWAKQADFLKQNLKYKHAAGRQSVMELLHQLLAKTGDDVVHQLSSTVFVPLVLVYVGDSDPPCREMAAILLAKLFERADEGSLESYVSLLDQWLETDKKPTVRSAAFQCLAIVLRHGSLSKQQIEEIRAQAEQTVTTFVEDVTDDATPLLRALEVVDVLLDTYPEVAFAVGSTQLWKSLENMPSSIDAEIHEVTAKLQGTFFTDIASTSSRTEKGLAALPLKGSGGLTIDAGDMRRFCSMTLRALRVRTSETHGALMTQGVRNLVFLGRCFAANDMGWNGQDGNESEGGESDDDEPQPESQTPKTYSALAYLFNRLAAIVRQDKYTLLARTAAVQCQAALINQVERIPDLQVVLRPLYALTDPSIPKPPGEAHKTFVDRAQELLELVQKKIGAEDYVAALAVTRSEAKARRDERRQKRRIDAVAAPERRALEKKRKHEAKKAKQKQRGEEARSRRRGW